MSTYVSGQGTMPKILIVSQPVTNFSCFMEPKFTLLCSHKNDKWNFFYATNTSIKILYPFSNIHFMLSSRPVSSI